MNKRYTAPCGLCCLDCIPSKKSLFAVVKQLEKLLYDVKFEHYAKLKSQNNKIFREYPQFVRVLEEIGRLQCVAPCSDGGGKPHCEVKECVVNNTHDGCWQCEKNEHCDLLAPLKSVHPNLAYHLELIKEEGPENWGTKRKAHYFWEE